VRRFDAGDLTLTIGLMVPSGNGHVVRVLKVLGPIPERNTEFRYEVQRLDRKTLERVEIWPEGILTEERSRDTRVHTEEKNLQCLVAAHALASTSTKPTAKGPHSARCLKNELLASK
jgi:hypothetical protein